MKRIIYASIIVCVATIAFWPSAPTPLLAASTGLTVDIETHREPIDRSGTITSGGNAQVIFPVTTKRRGYFIQNNSSGDLWFNDVGVSSPSQPSVRLVPGAYYSTDWTGGVTYNAISIFGSTTGQGFSAREW